MTVKELRNALNCLDVSKDDQEVIMVNEGEFDDINKISFSERIECDLLGNIVAKKNIVILNSTTWEEFNTKNRTRG